MSGLSRRCGHRDWAARNRSRRKHEAALNTCSGSCSRRHRSIGVGRGCRWGSYDYDWAACGASQKRLAAAERSANRWDCCCRCLCLVGATTTARIIQISIGSSGSSSNHWLRGDGGGWGGARRRAWRMGHAGLGHRRPPANSSRMAASTRRWLWSTRRVRRWGG